MALSFRIPAFFLTLAIAVTTVAVSPAHAQNSTAAKPEPASPSTAPAATPPSAAQTALANALAARVGTATRPASSAAANNLNTLPDFTGDLGQLLGAHQAFTATAELQTVKPVQATMTGPYAFDHGKSRFEMDLSKATKASDTSAQAAIRARLPNAALNTLVYIARPDKGLKWTLYPGLKGYIEIPNPAPVAASSASAANAANAASVKMEVVELTRETVDGHPCIENKVILTAGAAAPQEYIVWNATDLKNFPVKIEFPGDSGIKTITFKNLKLDAPAPDAFDLPAGFTRGESQMDFLKALTTQLNNGNPPGPPNAPPTSP